jgi:hypothetical protein
MFSGAYTVLGRLLAEDGKGYQDILIWETLKAQLHRDSHVVLVSNDGDFADSEGRIRDASAASSASRCAYRADS